MKENIITLKNITKKYGKRVILDNISLTINANQITGLLGPNGSGKTSLFYIVAGLIYPDAGTIEFNGVDISHYPMYKRAQKGIGYLPQEASVFKKMTVAQNILSVLELQVSNKKHQLKRLDEILDTFSIAHIKDSYGSALSGGERRRVEIARLIANEPSFVLLDEPFAGVDPLAVAEISDLIKSLKQINIGVLITDHNVKDILGVVDLAHVLSSGNIIFSGTNQQALQDPTVKKVYLG